MTNAFSVLTLKRHRSTSLSQISSTTSEPVNKLSRSKLFRFSVISKFTNTINSERTNNSNRSSNNKNNNKNSNNRNNHTNGFFLQLFRTNQQVKDNDDDEQQQQQQQQLQKQQQDEQYIHFDKSANHNKYHLHEQNNKRNIEHNHYSAPLMTPITNKKKKLKSILVTKTKSYNSTTVASYTSDPTQPYSSQISTSNMTVNSEDLTAKEFASLAGIRIISESDEEEDGEERYKEDGDDDDDDDDDEEKGEEQERWRFSEEDPNTFLHTLSFSSAIGSTGFSSTSKESNLKPKIWNHEFWMKPNDNNKMPPLAHHSSTITTSSSSYQEQYLPPILNEFRRMGTYNSSSHEKSNVIRKGRFEIYLEN